jgi:hypothetical protein
MLGTKPELIGHLPFVTGHFVVNKLRFRSPYLRPVPFIFDHVIENTT